MPYKNYLSLALYLSLGFAFESWSEVKATTYYLGSVTHLTECDVGSEVILHCNGSSQSSAHILWLKDGREFTSELSWNISEDRLELFSHSVLETDAGQYACIVDNQSELQELNTLLVVRTSPAKLENVTVHATTIIALVHWHVANDGGYPITHFTLVYRHEEANATNDTWQLPVPIMHISPSTRQYFVHHLTPNTTYMFRLWATNKLGPGEAITIEATTITPLQDPPEILQQMLHGDDMEDFSATAWMVAVSMVLGTVLILSCLSCILIYKEGRNSNSLTDEDEDTHPHIITNPGFEIDLEESFLLDQADINFNTETPPQRTNNNTIVRPSRV